MVTPSGFDEFLSEHGILFALVARLDREEFITLGRRELLAYDGLITGNFGDPICMEGVSNVVAFLTGRTLPQMMAQGEVSAVLCMPQENVLVALFCHDTRDVLAKYDWCEELNAELERLWGGGTKAGNGQGQLGDGG